MEYCTIDHPKTISIDPSAVLDPFYRYKMPQLSICYIKGFTHLKNLNLVATSLHCSTNSIIKYLSSELGTQCNNKKLTLSGIHTPERLSELIIAFIDKIILCSGCSLPELSYIKNNNKLILECRSCGFTETVSSRSIPKSITNNI